MSRYVVFTTVKVHTFSQKANEIGYIFEEM